MTFYVDDYKITRIQKNEYTFYIMESENDMNSVKRKKSLEEIDGFTITKDIRDSFKFPFVFENHMGIYISYMNKNEKIQKSYITKPNNVSCGPLFKLESTVIGDKIDLSKYIDVKSLYNKFRITPTGKTICIPDNIDTVKWSADLLLSQLNVYPEKYNDKVIKSGVIFYFVSNPLPIRKKYSNSEILLYCKASNDILNSILLNKTKSIIENIRNVEDHMMKLLYVPNSDILNLEPSILEFCRKMLEIKT